MKTLFVAAFIAGFSLAASALAQTYPAKPVRVIVPLTAGSAVDLVGRAFCQSLSQAWGQPVVVENRAGAGGSLGTALVAKTPPDGYTLLVSGSSHVVNAALYASLPYDPQRDFVEVAPLATVPQALLVAPQAGMKDVGALIAAAKAAPGRITFATPGVGTGNHLATEKLRLMSGIDVVHVPYKGGPEAMADVAAGRVTFLMTSIGAALPLVQQGRLVALGVSSSRRAAALPGVPTLDEAGVRGYEDGLWFGLWAPAGTPAAIVERIAADVAKAQASPEMREQLAKLAAEPLGMSPGEFAGFVRRQTTAAAQLASAAGIKPQ